LRRPIELAAPSHPEARHGQYFRDETVVITDDDVLVVAAGMLRVPAGFSYSPLAEIADG
jgi:hypothetical protein